MHWFEFAIYATSATCILTALAIGVMSYRFYKAH